MRLASFGILCALAAFADTQGIRPRADVSEYRAHDKEDGINIAADVMDSEQVRHAFASSIYNGYVVIEVAVYPESGQSVDISSFDFMLRVDGLSSPIRPSSARTIAAVLQRKASKPTNPSDVTLYPTVGVGYESGGGGYDPVYGNRRGGWRTNAGVGVATGGAGNGQPAPASTDLDRSTMERELGDKALPEGPASKAVAGYLYFPLPAKKKPSDAIALDYHGSTARIHISFPPASKQK
jgi:hypothetical protein